MDYQIPATQRAVQLTGPDELAFNGSKEVHQPGPYQILAKIEAVGLCFSDLKLLKQFSGHVRKSEVLSGIDQEILDNTPGYVTGEKPTVPGHEATVRIVAVGDGVEKVKAGSRYLVQADYRWLKTQHANGAFGYNFEGGLQEYVLFDERIITSPEGDSMLLPVSEDLSASAIALVEPWACVENAYVSTERQNIKSDGNMLIAADVEVSADTLANLFERFGTPEKITWLSKKASPTNLSITVESAANISDLDDAAYDDVIYFGADIATVQTLFAKVAARGLINIVQCGGKFGAEVETMVGRVHYGGIRIIGCSGSDPSDSMEYIPATDEISTGDKINVIGAGGPMGVMHVIRNICQGVEGVSVLASDVDDNRLAALTKIAAEPAEKNSVQYKTCNVTKEQSSETFDYIAVMAPVPALVAASVTSASENGRINIFAGIPAHVTAKIDLDTYIAKKLYFIGTSGSLLSDMKTVLEKVESHRLDTNCSVAAVCGLEHAIEGIRAVEARAIAGKILVYPDCKGLELIELKNLSEKMPEVAKSLKNGLWTIQAEQKLLAEFK